jgi:hypothetical protein
MTESATHWRHLINLPNQQVWRGKHRVWWVQVDKEGCRVFVFMSICTETSSEGEETRKMMKQTAVQERYMFLVTNLDPENEYGLWCEG